MHPQHVRADDLSHAESGHGTVHPRHARVQHQTTLSFLRMRAQVGTDPRLLEACGADPEQVARQIADDAETATRASRMLTARPGDPASIRMMGLTEQDLDDWATPPFPAGPENDDREPSPRHAAGQP